MDFELRIIVEKVAGKKQSSAIQLKSRCHPPESILDLGLRHSEQISFRKDSNFYSGRAI